MVFVDEGRLGGVVLPHSTSQRELHSREAHRAGRGPGRGPG